MTRGPGLESFDSHLVSSIKDVKATALDETPFRIALVGDWSGRASRSLVAAGPELKSRRFLIVDRDNLDQVMSKLSVQLHLPVTADDSLSVTADFNQLDDFHPDRMIERLDIHDRLRSVRSRLMDPATFAETAREIREWSNTTPMSQETVAQQESNDPEPASDHGRLLEQILEAGTRDAPNLARASDNISTEIRELVQQAIKPHLLPDDDSEREKLLAIVDEAMGRQLRALMHNPNFLALEASWQALRFLTRKLETGSKLKLLLLDMSRQEFEADLLGVDNIASTALYKLFVEQSPADPWAIICGNYDFGLTATDAKILERVSLLAQATGAPFIAAAKSTLIGCDSLAARPDPDDWRVEADVEIEASWNALKQLSSARYLGLALPRFLIRLPYGKDTDPIEEFDFDEFPTDTVLDHEAYVWANPAFAIVYLLAKAFARNSWSMQPGEFAEMEGLPLHVYHQENESHIKACAETTLTIRAVQKLIGHGLMPLISMKDTDAVRLGLVQSIAGTKLAGRWESN
jgi:type VI secretion system protein ImpC